MKHAAPTPRRYRALARDALFHSSNWLAALIVTYSVMLLFFCAGYLTHTLCVCFSLFYPIPTAVDGMLYLVWYLLLSPLLMGLLYYYTDLYRAAHGEGAAHVPPSVIFSPYSSLRTVVRAWGQITLVLSVCALIPLSLLPFGYVLRMLSSPHTGSLTVVLTALGGVTAFLAALGFGARLTPFLFLSAARPELSLLDAVRRTWHIGADFALTGILLQLGLIVGTLLSLFLTMGILFFIYVLPIAVFTYIGFCHELSRRCDLD